MLNIRFPSKVLVSVPIEAASRNSMYFKMLSEAINNEKIKFEKVNKIDLKELNWHEIGITHIILFFYWIGTENQSPNSYSSSNIYMFTLFADYFQLTDFNQKELINEIKQVHLESIYESIGKYLKIQCIPWIYMKEILKTEFQNNSLIRFKIIKVSSNGKCEENGYPVLLLKSSLKFIDLPSFYLKILLDWLDEGNLSVETFSFSYFVEISNFVEENKKDLISNYKTYLIALLRNYKIVHRFVNLQTYLEFRET